MKRFSNAKKTNDKTIKMAEREALKSYKRDRIDEKVHYFKVNN